MTAVTVASNPPWTYRTFIHLSSGKGVPSTRTSSFSGCAEGHVLSDRGARNLGWAVDHGILYGTVSRISYRLNFNSFLLKSVIDRSTLLLPRTTVLTRKVDIDVLLRLAVLVLREALVLAGVVLRKGYGRLLYSKDYGNYCAIL